MSGKSSAKLYSLIVGWEGLWTDLSYMRQGGYPTTAARQAFGGKEKKVIKGLVIGRFRFCSLFASAPLARVACSGIILCERWGWEIGRSGDQGERTRNLDVLARGRWQSADASHAAVSD